MGVLVRELNEEERNIYSATLVAAQGITPAFRDLLAILVPFRDESAATCYVDEHARLGLGEAFFHKWETTRERAEALIHEAMHIGNNHHSRMKRLNVEYSLQSNLAADFEINSAIIQLRG